MVKKADTEQATEAEQTEPTEPTEQTEPTEKKAPRKQRSLEERIAELQAKAAAKHERETERARAALVIALEQREKLEAKLDNVNTSIDELRAVVGEAGDTEAQVEPASTEE